MCCCQWLLAAADAAAAAANAQYCGINTGKFSILYWATYAVPYTRSANKMNIINYVLYFNINLVDVQHVYCVCMWACVRAHMPRTLNIPLIHMYDVMMPAYTHNKPSSNTYRPCCEICINIYCNLFVSHVCEAVMMRRERERAIWSYFLGAHTHTHWASLRDNHFSIWLRSHAIQRRLNSSAFWYQSSE